MARRARNLAIATESRVEEEITAERSGALVVRVTIGGIRPEWL
jgi:hypothetical protein